MYAEKPPAQEPTFEIFRPIAGQPKRFIIRSSAVTSIYTHWSVVTRFCPGPGCNWCQGGFERNWRGYVGVVAPPSRPGLLEINAAGFQAWDDAFSSQIIQGRSVEVSRASRYAGLLPNVSTTAEGKGWPILDTDEVFDMICRLLSLPRRSRFSDTDSWLASVRQFCLLSGPPISLKVLAG